PIYADCGSPPGSLESLDYLGRSPEKEDFRLSDFRGKIVVLSFWASWCKPCLKELPLLEVMKREDKNDELTIVALNYGERRQKFLRFLKKWKIEREMLMLHDPKDRPCSTVATWPATVANAVDNTACPASRTFAHSRLASSNTSGMEEPGKIS
ncbi:MAG: TlpA family protein disulfide reductase, partial [Symploca sp. SIO2G7]|nr:TlpA family protein disulfide reductase [Symploca sp. SIO2G7]